MRTDEKIESPRQSMSWLHTWASLILGWLLYAIFLTGTLSFFQSEISAWMKPEFHQSIPNQSQIQNTQVALNYLQKNHAEAGSWSIQLPNSRQNVTTLTIRKQGEDPRARRGGERVSIDSQTGEVLTARDTRGGSFLYRFHFELYGLPRTWARWIVGIATMMMLVAIVSGIITHKKIFKDFFTFRSGKGQRSWLDAHNATAVFALPFHIMITFSGLLLLLFTIMPWGVNQLYENRGQFLQDQSRSLVQQNNTERGERPTNGENPQARSEHPEGENQQARGERPENGENQQTRGERASRGERSEGRQRQAPQSAPLADLAPIITATQAKWKDNPIASINIINPNTNKAKIELRALHGESVAHRNIYASLEFNGVTGQNITNDSAKLLNPSIPTGIYNVTTVLHEARGVDYALRWLLFFSGIVGTMMVATGLILWCVKRAPQQQKQGYKSFGYRVVEVTNIAAIIGLPIACAAYFYANRFIPTEIELRLNWEIRTFFIIWLLTLIYAALRPHRQAWLELLMLATLAFALLPIINFATGGAALWQSIPQGLWMIASFDIAMWVLAALFAYSFYKVKKHQGLPSKKAKIAHKVQENEA
ncbi:MULTISPECIES: PepSY-associated TM helix domain-containing protein [unclassified Acinetobacter]|uniref:PepSY-associated TM helix domain-containing protein n=1 Tax=unclassified Acinetobacter TaxID=196816 RepID=UPI0025760533|nr:MULTISPECIES: PepSY-associated TM helix domain-containing protein [unclassified Acinetobacter]MDM1763630.1 PepSY domain-containing protein [Acinetobacter sp. 226-1]MDM1767109.1 PepSY domain-containing protein [Acinetobacter sp. 226-4]